MGAKQRSFTKEFKVKAVHLMNECSRTVAQLAREIEVSHATLYT